jgi:hypothetical protein
MELTFLRRENMKNLILIGLMMTAGISLASELNLINCKADVDGVTVEVSYSSSSFTGKPLFSAIIGGEQLAPVKGEPIVIQTDSSQFYNNVQVIVGKEAMFDGVDETFILRMPKLGYVVDGQANFSGVLEVGFTGGFRAPPAPIFVLKDVYALECEGQKVDF